MNIINIIVMAASTGLIGLFAFKLIGAAVNAHKESVQSNRRYVDTLKSISKLKKAEKLKLHTSSDLEGNTEIKFSMDGHSFKVTLSASRRLVSCIGYHRNYDQQTLYFSYDNKTDEFIDKKISSSIINDEKKDVKLINQFLDYIVGQNWDLYLVNEKEKDYELVNGTLHNIPQHSSVIEKKLLEKDGTKNLSDLLADILNSNIDIKEGFVKLIDTALFISGKIDLLEDAEIKYHFQGIVERDVSKTFYAYKKLNENQKIEYKQKFVSNIETMQTFLHEIVNSIENEDLFEVEKHLRVVKERYKK